MFANSLMEHLVPEKVRQSFADVHWLETIQLLNGLGYLTEDSRVSPRKFNAGSLQEAIGLFRSELEEYRLKDLEGYYSLLENLVFPTPEIGEEGELSADELRILKELVALDGDFRIFTDESPSQNPLLFRVLRFRLRFLGRIDHSAAPDTVEVALEKLMNWLNTYDQTVVFNLLGDLPGLINQMLDEQVIHGNLKFGVAFFPWEGGLGSKRAQKKEQGGDFLIALKPYLAESQHLVFEREIVETIYGGKERKKLKDRLQVLVKDEFNLFVLRLLQIQLWADGYLEGPPTGEWGNSSQEAFDKLLDSLYTTKKDQRSERERVQLYLTGKIGAFNVHHFWRALSSPVSSQKTKEEEALVELGTFDGEGPGEDVRRILKEFQEGLLGLPVSLRKQLQEGLADYQGKGFSQILNRFREQSGSIWTAFEQYYSTVQNAHIKLLDWLKQALKMVDQCLELLLNRTGFETDGVRTSFDFNWDAVHLIPEKVKPGVLNDHFDRLQMKRILMERSAQVVSQLVRWGVMIGTSSTTWILIAVQIAKYLFKQFLEWKRENATIRKAIFRGVSSAVQSMEASEGS